jgi:hypothetical protein
MTETEKKAILVYAATLGQRWLGRSDAFFNCGTGAGGFKEGNHCQAHGGGGGGKGSKGGSKAKSSTGPLTTRQAAALKGWATRRAKAAEAAKAAGGGGAGATAAKGGTATATPELTPRQIAAQKGWATRRAKAAQAELEAKAQAGTAAKVKATTDTKVAAKAKAQAQADTKLKAEVKAKAQAKADAAAQSKTDAKAARAKAKEDRAAAEKAAQLKADLARRDAELARIASAKAEREALAKEILANPGSRSGKLSHDQLDQAVKGVQSPSNEKAAIAALIQQHQSAQTVTGQLSGMSTPETFHTLDFQGIRYHFHPLSGDSAADAPIVRQFHDMMNSPPMPPKLAQYTKEVYFTQQANSHDAYWQVEYKDPNHITGATGGNGIVVYYGGHSGAGTLAHEAGHNLAQAHYGYMDPPAQTAFRRAMASGEKPVSRYGETNAAEDFAESVRYYARDRISMELLYPQRYAAIHELLGPA